ncbi:hypothetical protein BFP76_13195 [Amylibacter kogurei]|uniref:Uncharacterized protein n=1 Tax=Paramylibacter kogurei TaxID=1889778 RepID=A0A2G5K8R9_9RHOB|nr:hypothetical protein [Amylibacter kogurei]PIB25938.1 hypothetical protein BFP76_13195 [Amylibacter kogurei]
MGRISFTTIRALLPIFAASVLMVVLVPFVVINDNTLASMMAISGFMAVGLALTLVYHQIQHSDLIAQITKASKDRAKAQNS